eukprot:CAMPEP_0178962972 /NCGR_PEP_ID=MMETSP0789-20121207/14716_1 /TAXON_ID=3005 /ORGANISM="Rhizosolenia setigera, Strain CCMP 1694" /LENGTH=239 /DNA_ID=CAMNT_0020647291 /DNA_START=47 /DNA_END=766 /DNA_ORIENTATION=+
MGMVLGKIDVKEPSFKILHSTTKNIETPYDIREYGTRFAIETLYDASDPDKHDNPFRALAKYIGVFGEPENMGNESISMTAPVVMSDSHENKKEGTKIAMTAPVVMGNSDGSKDDKKMKKMQFILPEEYDNMSKIPKPTNPSVTVKELNPEVGAVHVFSGRYTDESNKKKALALGKQLRKDGLMEEGAAPLTEEYILENFQFFGYNPPFTIPALRRNEVFIPLTQSHVDQLIKESTSSS